MNPKLNSGLPPQPVRGVLIQGAVSAFISQWTQSDLELGWAGFASITAPEPGDAQTLASIWTSASKNDLGILEPTYRFLRLADHCVELRRIALKILAPYSSTSDHDSVKTLLKTTRTSNSELISSYETLLEQHEFGENQYTLFTKNLYLCHRIFLQDVIVRCCHVLQHLDPYVYVPQIVECVEIANKVVDHLCARMPYDFGDSGPHAQLENQKKAYTHTNATTIFHLSFSQLSSPRMQHGPPRMPRTEDWDRFSKTTMR